MEKVIYPCLWFDGQAEEAAKFYCSIFPNSSILSTNPLVCMFQLNGNKYMGLNGGPKFKANEAISFVINCDTQEEIDHFWYKLSEGGQEDMCGWLKDKYGISWQVVPSMLGTLMSDESKRERVTSAFLKMKKFDIAKLMEA